MIALTLFADAAVARADPLELGPAVRRADADAATSLTPGQIADADPAGFWRRGNMLGDMGGLRTLIGSYGLTLNLQETSELLGNVSGGVKRGADYDGLTTMTLQMDTQRAFGLAGGLFNVSALQIHGRNFSTENLSTLLAASSIAADRATRLWELWYQQTFAEGGLDVKLGQQSVDQEFIVSQESSLFINPSMGWPILPGADLYAGGPAYPLASLGARVRAQPTGNIAVLAGVFGDNPPGGPFNDDAQTRDASGTGFHLGTGALIMAEVQFAINRPAAGKMDDGTRPAGLPGTYKLGGWFDTAAFPDQRFDTLGLSLADPGSSGIARTHRYNFSLYGLMDQTVWRPDPFGPRSLSIFARLMGAPGDRNLIDFSIDAGVTLKAPFAGRDDDTAGIGFGMAHVSGAASALDGDAAAFAGAPSIARSMETFIEATYRYQLTPWWQLQPDFQYVFNPGAGIPDPNNPNRELRDEAIFGLRTNIAF